MSSLGAMAFVVLWTAIGYLSGAMMFSWLIARLFLHVDLTRVGDDNPGAYHLFRIGGFGWGCSVRRWTSPRRPRPCSPRRTSAYAAGRSCRS